MNLLMDMLPLSEVNRKSIRTQADHDLKCSDLEANSQYKSAKYLVVTQSNLNASAVKISGYRHASNLLIAASLVLPNTTIKLYNVPDLLDTSVLLNILHLLGADCDYKNNIFTINTKNVFGHEIPNSLSEKTHGSLYLMPALLARMGKCVFGKSGGCQIGQKDKGGERPIEHILDIMEKFGANISYSGEKIVVTAHKLKATTINIRDYSYEKEEVIGPLTSGATKTAILLALSIKEGRTVILNPFLKSESIDLIEFAKTVGFEVYVDSSRIELSYNEPSSIVEYSVISDPSEIITYMCVAGFHDIKLCLTDITVERSWPILEPELKLLDEIGLKYGIDSDNVLVYGKSTIKSADIKITSPGICTDQHPLLVSLMIKATGKSRITEYVWHDRFNYIQEVNKFGGSLEQDSNSVIITPFDLKMSTDIINCHDLRAAALLIILALRAPGTHVLTNFHHINRGYVNLVENLQRMGALIEETDSINVSEQKCTSEANTTNLCIEQQCVS